MTSVPKNSDQRDNDETFENTRVWDLPTRVFHWSLALVVIAGWLIGKNMSFSNIEWHFYLGYAVGLLVLFRLIWGLVGPAPVRLRGLAPRPSEVLSYLKSVRKREPSGVRGHNPLGALSVIAILGTLIVQVVTGLFSESEDLFATAPLAPFVSKSEVQLANAVHEVFTHVLLLLVVLHVVALLFYWFWKRENLIRAMITGVKLVRREPTENSQ